MQHSDCNSPLADMLCPFNNTSMALTCDKSSNFMVIPRITLNAGNSKDLPFILRKTQFPARLAFSMTVNKS